MRRLRGVAITLLLVLLVAFGGVVALFLLNNDHWVLVSFPEVNRPLDWSAPLRMSRFETPLAVIMLASFWVGAFAVVLVVYLPSRARRAWERRREERYVEGLEAELIGLRNLAVDMPAPFEDLDPDEMRGREEKSGAADLATRRCASSPSPPPGEAASPGRHL